MTASAFTSRNLLPSTGHAPGELLWGDAPRRQPIAPLILMAVLLLLVATPTAMGGNGSSANPIKLMRDVADSTYELTGLMHESNGSLKAIDSNSRNLIDLQGNMAGIAEATGGMAAKTMELNKQLGVVGGAVSNSNSRLGSVDGKLGSTAGSMGSLRTNVSASAASTKSIVTEFGQIDTAITAMDTNLKTTISQMAASGPLTKAFANNKTRLSVAGGNSKKYGVPNLAPDNRVMSVVLPMIAVMQHGGPLPARKDRHDASNFIVGTALKVQVPDGTNVVAMVRPFDGFYGLPDENFFVQNRIHGF
ncbi:MAG: hypothetical protein JWM86_1897 [Thermoleophilia bacterium]|nr:hypothetical protein [Thermoleophilia bacterium]